MEFALDVVKLTSGSKQNLDRFRGRHIVHLKVANLQRIVSMGDGSRPFPGKILKDIPFDLINRNVTQLQRLKINQRYANSSQIEKHSALPDLVLHHLGRFLIQQPVLTRMLEALTDRLLQKVFPFEYSGSTVHLRRK